MTDKELVYSAKVMPKGQVTIPKAVREILGVGSGDRVTFVVEDGIVTIVNSAVYAKKILQEQLTGKTEKSNRNNEGDAVDSAKSVREGK